MKSRYFYRIAKEVKTGQIIHCANVKKQRFSQARGKKWSKLNCAMKHLAELQNAGHENLFIDLIPEKIYRGPQAYTYKKWYAKKQQKLINRKNEERKARLHQMSTRALPEPEIQKSAQQVEIENALRQTNGVKTHAAKLIGIHPDTLRNRMKKLGI